MAWLATLSEAGHPSMRLRAPSYFRNRFYAGQLCTGPLPSAIDSTAMSPQGKCSIVRAEGRFDVAKPELASKRLCANCGAKFYDLQKDPIACPKCATVLAPSTAAGARP